MHEMAREETPVLFAASNSQHTQPPDESLGSDDGNQDDHSGQEQATFFADQCCM